MQYRTSALVPGLTSHAIRTRSRQVLRGVRAPNSPDEVSPRDRLDALMLLYPAAVFGGWTAAGLLGADYATGRPPMLWLPQRRVRHAVVIRSGPLPPEDIISACGRSVTSGVRTAVDLARFEPRDAAIAAVDQCIRVNDHGMSVTTALAMRQYLASHRYLHRGTWLREVLKEVDGRAESPPETHVRLLLHRAGFTVLEPQVIVPNAGYRVDLGAAALRVAVEYDGEYHRDRRQHSRDVARWNSLNHDHGWEVVLASADSLTGTGRADLLRQVEAALRKRGWRAGRAPSAPVQTIARQLR